MNFKRINESFDKLYKSIDEEYSFDKSVESKLTEALNKLNEDNISPEDQHDSDLIRSMLDKMNNRANAKFSPEEIAVMDKYGIKRDNNRRNLSVDGRDLYRQDVDNNSSSGWYRSKGYNNGTRSKINFADRARKLPQRKDTQIFTGPWTVDNDQINTHTHNITRFDNLQDAERYSQDVPMIDKIRNMKDALWNRNYYQKQIDGADAEREATITKAKSEYDKKIADAERTYKWHTDDAGKSRDRAQDKIDTMLKRKPVEESVEPRYEKMGIGQARLDILDRCQQLGVWEELFRDFLDHMTDEQVYKIAKAGDWLYTEED